MTTTAPLVCIVDDATDFLFLVEEAFTRYIPAYSVRAFDTGQAFLDGLAQLAEKPTLLLLDQHMPHLSGYQTLVALKQQPEYRSITVVMFSADASHSEMVSFYQAGAEMFIRKPMDLMGLQDALRLACAYAKQAN